MTDQVQVSQSTNPGDANAVVFAHVSYALLALGLFTGWIAAIAAVIVSYVKVDDVKGTWLESHFRWQIRTFWWGLLWTVIGWLLIVPFVIGLLGPSWIVWGVAWLWALYRVIKGWMRLGGERDVS